MCFTITFLLLENDLFQEVVESSGIVAWVVN